MPPVISEQNRNIQDDSGYQMEMEEILYDQIHLKWGNYINPSEKILVFDSQKPAIVSHFQIHDSVTGNVREYLGNKEFVIHRETEGSYELKVAPTLLDTPRQFFELAMSESFFQRLVVEESDFLSNFDKIPPAGPPASDFIARMAPGMIRIIQEMRQAPYQGQMKGMYLEAKAVELFLMQVDVLDREGSTYAEKQGRLPARDIDALHAVRAYMDQHYGQACSILDLSRYSGINQMKLKTGFKELFQTTVFGYLSDLRMQEAKRLLLDAHLSVAEVSDRVGYKHPHHFTAAFRKKFGVTPSTMKLDFM